MRRVLLEKKDIHKGSLVLVNRDHGLPRQIGGEQLQSLGGSVSMEKAAAASSGVCWKENGKSSVLVDSAAEKNRRNCIAGPWRVWRSLYEKVCSRARTQ